MIELNGKNVRKEKLLLLKEKLKLLNTQLGLVVIQVGNDEASNVYVKQKEKLATELQYKFIHKIFPETITNEEIINYISILNNDNSINGIIVQMPLPKHLDSKRIQNSIDPNKDVDGLTNINAGKLIHNENGLVPCTPKGIIELLDNYNIEIEGKNAVVIGRSILVGKPIAELLNNRNATVTICHSKTNNISFYTKNADIIVVAIGHPNFLTEDMVKENSIIIDVGINRINNKLVGDVDFENVSKKAAYITHVPGGIGPMTVYELMNNVYEAHQLVLKKQV